MSARSRPRVPRWLATLPRHVPCRSRTVRRGETKGKEDNNVAFRCVSFRGFRTKLLSFSSFFFFYSVVPLRNTENLHHKSTDDYVDRYVNDPII